MSLISEKELRENLKVAAKDGLSPSGHLKRVIPNYSTGLLVITLWRSITSLLKIKNIFTL
jgi:hypothetical protein